MIKPPPPLPDIHTPLRKAVCAASAGLALLFGAGPVASSRAEPEAAGATLHPVVYLRFENEKDAGGVPPRVLQSPGSFSPGGPVGGYALLGEQPVIPLYARVPPSTPGDNSVAIEFLFRPGRDFGKRALERMVSVGPVFAAFTAGTIEFGTPGDLLSIPLDGIGPKSLSHYLDEKWHHLVFQFNASTGLKEIRVDGALPEGFSRTVPPNAQLFTTPAGISLGSDLFHERFHGGIDELAVYHSFLSPSLIRLHQLARMAGRPYPMTEDPDLPEPPPTDTSGDYSPAEFAPGTAPGARSHAVPALEQLKRFPSPRYRTAHGLPRNPVYYSWESLGNGSSAAGGQLALELADRWNDHLTLQIDTATPARFADPERPEFHLKQITGQRPDLSFWAMIARAEPRARQKPDLPEACELREGASFGARAGVKSIKRLRPFASSASAQAAGCPDSTFDADATGVIKSLGTVLSAISPNTPIAGFSEPGEAFHPTPEALLQADPVVARDFAASGAGDWITFETRHQGRLDARFRDTVKASSVRLANSLFQSHAFEADSGEEREWPHYRQSFTPWKGQILPTPDFALRSRGRGISRLLKARREEIERGDVLYSPRTLAAPDSNELLNPRPAQNLGLQKILYGLGAPYTFPWLQEGSARPRAEAFIHEPAMVSYAQGVFSHAEELLVSGRLLEGDVPMSPDDPETAKPGYLFWGGDPRFLIVVRKDPAMARYLIAATFQPLSSVAGNAENSKTAQIVLEGQPLRFEVRRQGSVYVYDLRDPAAPVFYALDSWHEATHPYYWSSNPEIEAELAENGFPADGLALKTGTVAGSFVGSRTWVVFPALPAPSGSVLRFHWRPTDTATRAVSIYARNPVPGGTGRISVSLDRGPGHKTPVISSDQWAWYPVPAAMIQTASGHSIELTAAGGAVEVDKIRLSPPPASGPEVTREAR